MNQRVTGSIPGQGTCLGCGPGPHLGAHERQPHINVPLPLSSSLSLFLKINKLNLFEKTTTKEIYLKNIAAKIQKEIA